MTHAHLPQPLEIRRYVVIGSVALMLLFAGFGSWATLANISAATIATGRLGQNSLNREVQHLTGGQVQSIHVAEGDTISQGQVLVQLNDIRLSTDLGALNDRITELATRRDRLIAERDGAHEIHFSTSLQNAANADPAILLALRGQSKLYAARRKSWQQEREILLERGHQITLLAQGYSAQVKSLHQQSAILTGQLAAQETLAAGGIIPAAAVQSLKSEIAALGGKIGVAQSKLAEALAKTHEIDLEILRNVSGRREAAIEQLRDLEFRYHTLLDQHRAVQKQVDGLTLRAPVDGVVLGLGLLSAQTIIGPGQVLMQIVPLDRELAIQARVSPRQIAKVFPGQNVRLVFPNRTKIDGPDHMGTVHYIAPDTQLDQATGQPYFQVQIKPDAATRTALNDAPDIAIGMNVTLYLHTGDQPAWRYLAKPVLRFFSAAMRES